ncbi:MAG TPA: carboxypeptidase-like regulatory domain-containing protein, partial [Vicinamibacteria bacterium]
MRKPARLPLLLLVCLAPAGPARAQSQITTGVIQGTVVDQTGAVVPGAEVEARSLGQNVARSLTTGPDGRFVFLQLAP